MIHPTKQNYRLYSLTFIFLLFSSIIYAQDSFQSILKSTSDFTTILEEAETFFSEKYNLSGIELENKMIEEGGKDFKHFARWYHFNAPRVDAFGQAYDPRVLYAEAERRRELNPVRSALVDTPWRNIGPNRYIDQEIGVGRTSAVAFHPTNPDIYYVGGGIGGVWKTVNNGGTYIPVGDNLPTLSVNRIIVNSDDPNTIYVSTGGRRNGRSLGVFKSEDDGQSWQETPLSFSVEENKDILEMIAHPTNSDIMYVAVSNDGLYRTLDNFESVELVLSGNIEDVIFKPGDPDTIYAVDQDNLWRSTTGGGSSSFTAIQSFSNGFGDILLAVTAADPEKVYFTHGGLIDKYTGSGLTFIGQITIDQVATGDGSEIAGTGSFFMSQVNADRLYTGFVSHYRSDSDGAVFETRLNEFFGDFNTKVHVDFMEAFAHPLRPGIIYFCNDGGLYEYNEAQNSFEDRNNDLLITQFYDIAVSQDEVATVAGGSQDNGNVYRNQNTVWTASALSGDGMGQEINPEDSGNYFFSFQNGAIERVVNGIRQNISNGINQISGGVDGNDSGTWLTPYTLDPNDPNIIYAGYSRVYKSTNQGNSWEAISPQIAGFNGDNSDLQGIEVAAANSDYIYAVYNGTGFNFGGCYFCDSFTSPQLNVTRNGGTTWDTYDLPADRASYDIAVDPTDPEIIYMAAVGFQAGQKVFKSMNGGESWTNISGSLPNGPASAIETYVGGESGAVFVGTDTGVYYRDDSMSDWIEYGELPHTPVTALEINYATETLYAGTHGRSMFIAATPNSTCNDPEPLDDDNDGICNSLDICPNGDDTIDVNLNGVPDACDTYCVPEVSGSPNEQIHLVELFSDDGTLLFSNDTSGDQALYQDFSEDQMMTLTPGETYTLGVSFNFLFNGNHGAIYADFDGDRTWNMEEELIGVFDGLGGNTLEFPFTVPPNATFIESRMRIRMLFSGVDIPDPCVRGNGFAGETEDYGLLNSASFSVTDNSLLTDDVNIYPNPTRDALFVRGLEDFSVTYTLYDMSGRTIESQPYTTSIPVSKLSKGFYVVKLTYNGKSITKKFVKD